ncbi:hypothetical protein AALP_AA7G187800 [Arabis alpina]|uniref:RNase H type-1 domain-containing protein n=1 Tax=Arabis alpina TaxID=50452 RepID=A0A087GJ04_ARAAL|nr:hypothetical protein AALP_AA7G187800 [Arabis alpina]
MPKLYGGVQGCQTWNFLIQINLLVFQQQFVPWRVALRLARNDTSEWGGGQANGMVTTNPLESELQALIFAMQSVWCKRYRKIIFEGNNNRIQDLIAGSSLHFGALNWIREARKWMAKFPEAKLQWTSRKYNKHGDFIATHHFISSPYVLLHSLPHFLDSLLQTDFVNSS